MESYKRFHEAATKLGISNGDYRQVGEYLTALTRHFQARRSWLELIPKPKTK
ncbi:MAG: hypothetical protein ACJ8EY_07840 [Sphingomicrobium sp.]